IEIVAATGPQPTTLMLRDLHAQWSSASGEVQLGGRRPMHVEGHFSSEHVRRVTVDALIDAVGGAWTASGSVDGLNVSPEFKSSLPQSLATACTKIGTFRAVADSQFQLAYQPAADPSRPPTFDYQVEGKIAEGRWEEPRL